MLAFMGRTQRCGIVSCCKGCIGAVAGMGVVAMIGCHGAFPRVVFPFDVDLAPRRAGSLLVVYASGKNQEPQPRRITSNVKRNLHLLKIFKEFAKKQTSSPRPATSYRKKKIDKQDMPDSADDYEDPTTKLYHTTDGDFELATPVLLVDGYNMCGYWPKLKKHFARGHLDTARDKLVHELITFAHIKGVKVVCVFDAVMSKLPTHKEVVNSVDVVFSANSDSDSWIEREVTLLRADGCPKVWVATSDSFHQQAAHGAGAFIWSCKNLISEINDAKQELQELLQDDSIYSTKGKLLEHNLDPEVRDALQALKQQLRSEPAKLGTDSETTQ